MNASALCSGLFVGLALLTSTLAARATTPESGAVVECDRKVPRCWIAVRAGGRDRPGRTARTFLIRAVWRYVPEERRWIDATPKGAGPVTLPPVGAQALGASDRSRVLYDVPATIGLYRLTWTEDDRRYVGEAFVGPMLCNDVTLRSPPPPGMYAGCWPTARGATAGYLPIPP